jgi:hypothetical protein
MYKFDSSSSKLQSQVVVNNKNRIDIKKNFSSTTTVSNIAKNGELVEM